MSEKVEARLLVRCEVEVYVGSWEPASSLSSLHDLVSGEGVRKLKRIGEETQGFRVVGVPKVIAVTSELGK